MLSIIILNVIFFINIAIILFYILPLLMFCICIILFEQIEGRINDKEKGETKLKHKPVLGFFYIDIAFTYLLHWHYSILGKWSGERKEKLVGKSCTLDSNSHNLHSVIIETMNNVGWIMKFITWD